MQLGVKQMNCINLNPLKHSFITNLLNTQPITFNYIVFISYSHFHQTVFLNALLLHILLTQITQCDHLTFSKTLSVMSIEYSIQLIDIICCVQSILTLSAYYCS